MGADSCLILEGQGKNHWFYRFNDNKLQSCISGSSQGYLEMQNSLAEIHPQIPFRNLTYLKI